MTDLPGATLAIHDKLDLYCDVVNVFIRHGQIQIADTLLSSYLHYIDQTKLIYLALDVSNCIIVSLYNIRMSKRKATNRQGQ